MNDSQKQEEILSRKFKLFFFLPLYNWKKKGRNITWKILGIPVLKCRIKSEGHKRKYYLFGIPILKITKK